MSFSDGKIVYGYYYLYSIRVNGENAAVIMNIARQDWYDYAWGNTPVPAIGDTIYNQGAFLNSNGYYGTTLTNSDGYDFLYVLKQPLSTYSGFVIGAC